MSLSPRLEITRGPHMIWNLGPNSFKCESLKPWGPKGSTPNYKIRVTTQGMRNYYGLFMKCLLLPTGLLPSSCFFAGKNAILATNQTAANLLKPDEEARGLGCRVKSLSMGSLLPPHTTPPPPGSPLINILLQGPQKFPYSPYKSIGVTRAPGL